MKVVPDARQEMAQSAANSVWAKRSTTTAASHVTKGSHFCRQRRECTGGQYSPPTPMPPCDMGGGGGQLDS